MVFFDWVNRIGTVAAVTIVALVLALSILTRPAADARSEMVEIVRAWFKHRPRSDTYVLAPTLSDALVRNLSRSTPPARPPSAGSQPEDTS